jgi:hypothetical protein
VEFIEHDEGITSDCIECIELEANAFEEVGFCGVNFHKEKVCARCILDNALEIAESNAMSDESKWNLTGFTYYNDGDECVNCWKVFKE